MAALGEEFNVEDHVGVHNGDGNVFLTGTVIGISSKHIIDFYILLLDEPGKYGCEQHVDSKGKPWKAITVANTQMKRLT